MPVSDWRGSFIHTTPLTRSARSNDLIRPVPAARTSRCHDQHVDFWQSVLVPLLASIIGGLIAYFGTSRSTRRSLEAATQAQERQLKHRDEADLQTRRIGACLELLEAVSIVESNVNELTAIRPPFNSLVLSKPEILRIVQHAERAFVPVVSQQAITERMHTLVRLANTAAFHLDADVPQARAAGDLRHYCWFVRLTLQSVIDRTAIPNGAATEYPLLNRRLDNSLWFPLNVPTEWSSLAESDPGDPQFRPIGPPRQ